MGDNIRLHPIDLSEAEEDGSTRTVLVEAGLVLTRNINIASRLEPQDLLSTPNNTPTQYPRGILTPGRRNGNQSFKAVSFNPRTEFKVLDEL